MSPFNLHKIESIHILNLAKENSVFFNLEIKKLVFNTFF